MPKVDIYRLDNSGEQKIVVTCWLEKDSVVLEGENKILIENLRNNGIKDYSSDTGARLFPEDGLVFLENLEHHYKSGYLNASEVSNKEYLSDSSFEGSSSPR